MIALPKQFQSWGSSLYEVSIASLDAGYVVNFQLTTIGLFETREPKKMEGSFSFLSTILLQSLLFS